MSSRGDDQKTLLNRWGQRVVHVLLVFVPSVLIAGLVFQRAGYHGRSMEFAQAFIGITFTLVGLLAVAIVIYETLQTSRQTELTEFETFRE